MRTSLQRGPHVASCAAVHDVARCGHRPDDEHSCARSCGHRSAEGTPASDHAYGLVGGRPRPRCGRSRRWSGCTPSPRRSGGGPGGRADRRPIESAARRYGVHRRGFGSRSVTAGRAEPRRSRAAPGAARGRTMGPNLHERAERVLSVLHRVRAGGERFVGAFLPGASARRMRVAAVADEWSAANLEARHGSGPLWVVLGDGASLGLGASTRDIELRPARRRGSGRRRFSVARGQPGVGRRRHRRRAGPAVARAPGADRASSLRTW